MHSGFASPERESDQRPVNSASGGRIATPVCALARNDRRKLREPDTHIYFFHSLRPRSHRRGRPIVHKDIIEKERKRDIIIIQKICGEEAAA